MKLAKRAVCESLSPSQKTFPIFNLILDKKLSIQDITENGLCQICAKRLWEEFIKELGKRVREPLVRSCYPSFPYFSNIELYCCYWIILRAV